MPSLRNIINPFVVSPKNTPSQKSNGSDQLHKLANQSSQLLLTIRSRRFFSFLRSTLSIDINKINISHRHILGQTTLHSVLVENISDVSVECSFFNATLVIVDSCNPRYPVTHMIYHLPRPDAYRARRLIQGLVYAKLQNIDLTGISAGELMYELEKIGKAQFLDQN